ncbi:MAG: hypothetical protein HKM95_13705 [Inquilinus sp.]|nr:hypothetical protein [Inquilinus sp.]
MSILCRGATIIYTASALSTKATQSCRNGSRGHRFVKFPFSRRQSAPAAHVRLYLSLVDQSREPAFFERLGVPDTVDGRFDMIVLHVFLLLDRLRGHGERAELLAQALFDHMFSDMDQNLREMGVGDLSVGKKVKAMGEAFYGRAAAYRTGLEEAGDGALMEALRRNLFRKADPQPAVLAAMVGYLRRESTALAARPLEGFLAGVVVFGPPPSVPAATMAG